MQHYFDYILFFSPDKKHHFESLNNNEMVDSEVLVTRKSYIILE